jgi:hypothetical protein
MCEWQLHSYPAMGRPEVAELARTELLGTDWEINLPAAATWTYTAAGLVTQNSFDD